LAAPVEHDGDGLAVTDSDDDWRLGTCMLALFFLVTTIVTPVPRAP
jgi:hypothetical protein